MFALLVNGTRKSRRAWLTLWLARNQLENASASRALESAQVVTVGNGSNADRISVDFAGITTGLSTHSFSPSVVMA